MECVKKQSHDPVFRCLIGWACAQNLCRSRQKAAICPPCPNSNLPLSPWHVANLRYCFWQRRCLRPDKARYRCRGAYCGGNKRYCSTRLRCLRSKKLNGNRVHLITDDVHFFGGKQIMRAILGVYLVMVAHDPFTQWTVLNQIALQGYRGITLVEWRVFGIFRKSLFHADIVEPNAVWQDGCMR